MFEPLGPKRKLPFPLYNEISNGNIVDVPSGGVNDFVWPEDPTERTILPLYVSQQEFTAILSSVDVGADIAYPLQYIEVYWFLVRNLRYSMPICDLIIDCINNNPATQQAIVNAIMQSDEYNEYLTNFIGALTGPQIEGKLIYGSCEEAVVAGKVIALVARLDENNKDALEIIEVGTNDEEKVAAILEGIPVLGEAPFGDIIDFLQDVIEDFQENYEAASTFERRDDLAEDLYCLALSKPDCELTYGDLYGFFNARAASGLTLASGVQNLIEWIALGDFSSDDLVFNAMMALQIASIRMGGVFFGVNMPAVGSLTRDAEPSTRYEEWDECPTEWCRHFDAAHELETVFTPTGGLGPQAVFVDGAYHANDALIPSRITLEMDLGSEVTINRMRLVFSGEPTPAPFNQIGWYREHFGAAIDGAEFQEEAELYGPIALQKSDIDVVSSFDASVPITVGLTDIYLYGSGTPPDVGEPC